MIKQKKSLSFGLKFLFGYAKKYKGLLLLALLCSLFYVACYVMIPILSGQCLDLMKTDASKAYGKVCFIIGLAGGAAVFYYGLNYIANYVAYKMVCDMRKESMEKILHAEISSLDKKSGGEVISTLISDVDIISQGLIMTFLQLFNGVFTILSILVLMLVLCYPLALVVILLTPLSMIAAAFIAKGTAKSFKAQSDQRGRLSSLGVEDIENQKTVKANSYEETAEKKFDIEAEKLRKLDFRTEFFNAFINPTTRLLNALVYGTVAVIGALFIIEGRYGMSEGSLMTFLMFTNNYTDPFNQISEVIAELQNASASAARLQELLSLNQVPDESGKKEITHPDGSFALEDVHFAYEVTHPVLNGVSFKVEKGMKVALVGPTGCGKTTLINLVMRFYDPNSGTILVSGNNIKDVKRSSLRSVFGMVLQDTWVFKGTIKENIAYGNPQAKMEDIVLASKEANADFFIQQMKDGYDTYLNGANSLSEGQKQLICIARLMLKKPEMLILDEATSNIDTRSELLVQKGFDKIMEGRTSLVIAHRLSTIVSSDLILVMKDGVIAEAGKHEELLKKNGYYADIYNSQFAEV